MRRPTRSRTHFCVFVNRPYLQHHATLGPEQVGELLSEATQQRERERAAQAALGQLTDREREVLQVLAEGLSDKEIAQRLHVSLQTVHTHMAHILSKFGVASRLRALVYAARYGAISLR